LTVPVSIVSCSSLSSLGNNPQAVWDSYLKDVTFINNRTTGNTIVPVAALPEYLQQKVSDLQLSDVKYKNLDKSVLYAILASRSAVKQAGWGSTDVFGINIGSSRGATGVFEHHYAEFLATGKTSVQASPVTTLGNISSWVAHDLRSTGPDISHSVTCSTGLHSVLNAVAWIQGGLADKFIAGGSEAPLTPFTIAQMQAMKIYSDGTGTYPCRALDLQKSKNTMVLGEGAACIGLEAGIKETALACIEGIGYATEILQHSVSLSTEAECLQKSMAMALTNTDLKTVDTIVMHAPGTVKGDASEFKAIQKVFGSTIPLLTTNKWKTGHTFGASGVLSLEMALLMIQHNKFTDVPYLPGFNKKQDKAIRKVLVNAVGFGGNAVSILVSK